MTTFEELLEIFEGTDFTRAELRKFYFSIKKSVVLGLVGKRSWHELFSLEEKCQWPVLRKIGDPELSIYTGADKALLERFLRTITEEKSLRDHRSSFEKVRYWSVLQSLIDERTGLFTHIFGFSKKEVEHCRAAAARYAGMRDKRIASRKRMWKIGIGTGAATLAGAAALWYASKKDKK